MKQVCFTYIDIYVYKSWAALQNVFLTVNHNQKAWKPLQ